MSLVALSRDKQYYFPEGNVVLLVSPMLFKVHRHILARDGSIFENMFTLDGIAGNVPGSPENSNSQLNVFQQDGSDDESPIVLQGDTPSDFRCLLQCLYALPQDIAHWMSFGANSSDLGLLTSVLMMAHKYHFVTTESWASRTLLEHIHDLPPSGRILSEHMLVRISEVATKSSDEALLAVVRTRWRRLIAENRHLGPALTTTELVGPRSLQGLAYLAVLLQGRSFWNAEPSLTREHRIRLLSGFHNLTHFCAALPDTPPPFAHRAGCADARKCEESWARIWRGVFVDLGSDGQAVRGGGEGGLEARMQVRHHHLDVVGRLMMAISIVNVIPATPDLAEILGGGFASTVCEGAAMDAVVAFSRKTQDELMDFFEDVV
ncbi:hypothetical protein BDN70DRAFT_851402 [Pholiota conissans]|uniref:BTB domain-containing protein n=1 Tax=Pholiota conissans TaxID=109636 RepID=A0A9P6CX20_9AGAR|nr:hypothetical protein BDN70DRAFT_851402 [Pholiota conissans]